MVFDGDLPPEKCVFLQMLSVTLSFERMNLLYVRQFMRSKLNVTDNIFQKRTYVINVINVMWSW